MTTAMPVGGGWKRWLPALIGTAGMTVALLLLSRLLDRPGGAGGPAIPGRDIALAVHIVSALAALPLGGFVLWRRKGDAAHRRLGRIWAALMLVVAISSYWLRTLSGGFSFIHLLSVLTLIAIPLAVFNVRRGNIKAHVAGMRGLYIGLVVAGLFALMPGRTIGHLIFG